MNRHLLDNCSVRLNSPSTILCRPNFRGLTLCFRGTNMSSKICQTVLLLTETNIRVTEILKTPAKFEIDKLWPFCIKDAYGLSMKNVVVMSLMFYCRKTKNKNNLIKWPLNDSHEKVCKGTLRPQNRNFTFVSLTFPLGSFRIN